MLQKQKSANEYIKKLIKKNDEEREDKFSLLLLRQTNIYGLIYLY